MTQSSITPILIDDVDFLVSTTIERCPRTMMVRELAKNAMEAASLAPEGSRQVIFRTVTFNDTPKLAIWNTGPGMDAAELYRMCDLASSIRKQKGLDANFGMGAKVPGLPRPGGHERGGARAGLERSRKHVGPELRGRNRGRMPPLRNRL